MKNSVPLLAGVLFSMLVAPALANNQNPNLNWGSTDFMDAAIPGSGVILNPKVVFYTADSFKDGEGTVSLATTPSAWWRLCRRSFISGTKNCRMASNGVLRRYGPSWVLM